MISMAALRRLERLQLASDRRLTGLVSGEHRSNRQGSSLDFMDFREYQPGDDVRRVDSHHLARHDELRIKVFEADDELVLRILLDTSASMAHHDKHIAAASVAAALGAVAMASGDTVALHAFPAAPHPQRFVGRHGVPALLAALDRMQWGGPTPFARTARSLLSQPGPAGMTVVISDLLTLDWHETITRLPARGADLLVVHVRAVNEGEPDVLGDLSLEDVESGELVSVSLTADDLTRYRARSAAWAGEVRSRCHDVGGRYLPVDAADDIEELMTRSWRATGVLR